MNQSLEYISFGGGPPSLALAILNANGFIRPKAQSIIFADTGAEKEATYRLNDQYEAYFSELGFEWIAAVSKDGFIKPYIRDKSVVIPVHTEKGLGRRQCTDHFKIRAIREEVNKRYGNVRHIAQLAMTWDEALRMRDSKYKDTTNRFPLIEHKITRAQCVQIIQEAGLPVPPWSACYFCPLQSQGVWRQLASEHPTDFEKAVAVDNSLPEGKTLHWSGKPLSKVYSSEQLSMFYDPTQGACDSGYCFT